MTNNQSGIAPLLLVALVAVIGVGGYFAVSSRSDTSEQSVVSVGDEVGQVVDDETSALDRAQGASYVPKEDHIQVLFPVGGEVLVSGQSYTIQWGGYQKGGEPVTVFLSAVSEDGRVLYAEKLATNVPTTEMGSFVWKVLQPSFARYKIEVYPEGGREYVGYSGFFSISGGQALQVTATEAPTALVSERLIVNEPLPTSSVSNPIKIKGKARNIFFEGEFAVKLMAYDYPLGHPKYAEGSKVITVASARAAEDCDWMSGQWCDFEATVTYPSAVTGVEHALYFYDGGQGDPGTPAAQKFVAGLSIVLK